MSKILGFDGDKAWSACISEIEADKFGPREDGLTAMDRGLESQRGLSLYMAFSCQGHLTIISRQVHLTL